MPNKNDVGAIWLKSNDRGEYLSIKLELPHLLELAGGDVNATLYLNAYPTDPSRVSASGPAYHLKYYPKTTTVGGRPPAQAGPPPPPPDDDIPF